MKSGLTQVVGGAGAGWIIFIVLLMLNWEYALAIKDTKFDLKGNSDE